MEDSQLKAVIGLFAGIETAVVHMSTILTEKGIATRQEIAASYRQTAANILPAAQNRDLIALVLNQIAQGVEGSSPHEETRSLLRLIQGGKPSPPEPS